MSLNPEDAEILKSAPMLRSVSDEMRDHFVARLAVREYPKHAIVFSEDASADHFYFVINGWVRLCRVNANGKRADVGLFGPGESFGEAAMFLSGRFPVQAEIVEDARLARMRAVDLQALLADHPGLCFGLLGSLSLHLRSLVDKLTSDRLRTAEQRLGGYLVTQCPPGATAATLSLPFDKSVLAGVLGMAPEALSRSFAALRDLGVEVHGHDIHVTDVPKLRLLML